MLKNPVKLDFLLFIERYRNFYETTKILHILQKYYENSLQKMNNMLRFNKCNRNVTKYQRVELRQNYDKDNKESSCYNNDSRNNDIDSYDS